MTTKTKIIIALVVVSIIVGISLFFYYRGKKKAAADAAADAAAKSKLLEVKTPVVVIKDKAPGVATENIKPIETSSMVATLTE